MKRGPLPRILPQGLKYDGSSGNACLDCIAGMGVASRMIATTTSELSEVLNRVRAWTPAMKITLARKVLESIGPPEVSPPARTMAIDEVIGILKTDAPSPDDMQCAEIVAAERARKYG